uniref:Uncharacterized protein n=1 Tax=Anguilla anguilla TaxID=7936 RepID=A0A0E9XIX4_ANGAN
MSAAHEVHSNVIKTATQLGKFRRERSSSWKHRLQKSVPSALSQIYREVRWVYTYYKTSQV